MLTIYSKTTCPFCVNAKSYLSQNQIPYVEIDVEQDPAALDFIRNEGHRTVPQIYLNGKLFVAGGWQGLSNLAPDMIRQEMELRQALDDVDAI
jgi:glutaredoxin